ncbi:hypothetical protein M9435_004694 [Picochlorum sp. BPE23]|nr:hypothetical protein M9435_004694 [Picochlorum sp. BPE23]
MIITEAENSFQTDEPGFWRHQNLGVGDIVELYHSSTVSSGDDFDLYSKRRRNFKRIYSRDEYKESSRKLFRTVFDFENWAEHRATTRYLRHISGIFDSRLVRGLSTPLVSVAMLATVVAIGHELLHYKVLVIPEELKDVLFLNSALPMSLTSSILGLLLVFRTNSSYSRWLDARKNWGLLTNRSRDIVRQGLTWLPQSNDESTSRMYAGMLCRWVVAFSYCLKCHLRENEDAVEKLRQLEILHENELDALSRVRHKPMYAIQVLSMLVRRLSEMNMRPDMILQSMDSNITQLEDICGSCERILRTPIPLSYTRHTSRFMIIWLSLLPFALWESCGWGMVPLSVAISLLTLGVEEIGVIIEEPFSVLPLERICATIASDIKEIRAHGSQALDESSDIIPVSTLFE